MSDIAIRVEGLGKQYRIGRRQASYGTLRDSVSDTFAKPFRAARSLMTRNGYGNGKRYLTSHPRPLTSDSDFWALKDISFNVKRGEVVGIIGRNGAGKSTLLKILSRITEPTEGEVDIYGRVGSLLEVGTGFHPELTGRENIFLNGAILGMRQSEIKSRFDEIIAFAEIERFIDTPVKHYSSGMYVRLAFGVAAHLNPEVLLVDEVLAVGDAEFQKKCLGQLEGIAKNGRTVIFVSHNMAAVQALCSRCILLERGNVKSLGPSDSLISEYLSSSLETDSGQRSLISHPRRLSNSQQIMTEVTLLGAQNKPASTVSMGSPLSVRVDFANQAEPIKPFLGIVFKTTQGLAVFGVNNRFMNDPYKEALSAGTMICHLEKLPLMPGRYFLDLYLEEQSQCLDVIHEAISIEVVPADVFGTGHLPPASSGPVFCPATWVSA